MKKATNANAQEHWEIRHDSTVRKETDKCQGAAFSPMPSKKRTKTYVPINDQDT